MPNFNLDYKKIILGLGLLLAAGLIGFSIYWVFFRTAPPPAGEPATNTNTNTGLTGQLPTAEPSTGQPSYPLGPESPGQAGLPISETAKGGITYTAPLTKESSQFVTWLGGTPPAGGLTYYQPKTNQFYRLTADGQSQLLTDKKFYNVSNVVWAPNQDKAILEYPDGSKTVYDFNTGQQVSLPKHWQDFDFSGGGDQIVAKSLGLDPENRWLIVSNADGSQAKKIEPLGENEDIVTVGWSPNNQVIATYVKGIDFDRQDLFFVGLNNENFKKTTIEGRGFQGLWSSQGDRMLYSVYNSNNGLRPELWVVDAQGDSIGNNRRRLQIQTWADKCVFAGNTTLYCGVPESLEEGSGLFPQLANSTTDRLYRIDLKTNSQEMIAQPNGDYAIDKLLIAPDQSALYFTDAKTGQIFKVRLK
ncbi:MAG: hypothetical protein V1684_02750 [bacterium]